MTSVRTFRKREVLEHENILLRERIAELESVLGDDLVVPRAWELSPMQARLMKVLVARPQVSVDAAMAALYRDLGRDAPGEKTLQVMICHMRRKLAPHGVEILTIFGQGYSIESSVRGLLKRAMSADADHNEAQALLVMIAEGVLA